MNERVWFSVPQAAEHAGVHRDTIRKAAESAELHGYQRKVRGHWRIHRDCLDAWVSGVKCDHLAAAS